MFLPGDPAARFLTLETGKGHLCERWIRILEGDLKELEAPEDVWRLGNLGVGDVLRGLHIQEQCWYPRERNHLTTCLDLYKDHLGLGGLAARLGLRGELEVKVGLGSGGGLYVRSFVNEAQSHQGRVGII